MAEPQYKGSKPGYKKAPTQSPNVQSAPAKAVPNPPANDTSKRAAAPRPVYKGTKPGAH